MNLEALVVYRTNHHPLGTSWRSRADQGPGVAACPDEPKQAILYALTQTFLTFL